MNDSAVKDPTQLEFISILHPPGYHRFTQDLANDWPKSYWSRTDEYLRMPPATGKEQIFVSVNPICQRITDDDRAKPKFSGKSDTWIAERIAAKIRTVAAVTTLIRDYDAKDFTDPSQAEIIAQYEILRANPDKADSTDKALLNEAVGAAKSAKFKTKPTHYKALALAHVEALTPAPSAIIASGGGYNCYWLLDEPFQIRTNEHDYSHHVTSYAADVQKRWVHMDARADQGVNDIRRILRPVGTINHKAAYGPDFPVVSFVKKAFTLRYSLAELIAYLPQIKTAPAKVHTVTARTATEPTETAQDAEQEAYEGDSVIFAYNAKHKIADVLEANGYTRHGDRMMRPGGDGQPGVNFDEAKHPNQSFHHSSNDPLNNGYWRHPFDVFKEYEHGGNLKKAVYFAAVELVMVKAPVDVAATVEQLRFWIRTHSFSAYVSDEFKTTRTNKKTGETKLIYVTDATDTKIADAVLDAMQESNRLDITIGKKRLGKLAGVSCNTAMKTLKRLHGWLFKVTPDKFGAQVALVEKCRFQQIDPVLDVVIGLTTRDQSNENDKMSGVINEYSPRKATDPFLSGTSRHMKDEITKAMGVLEPIDVMNLGPVPEDKELLEAYKEAVAVFNFVHYKEQLTFAAFGESGLRVLDALLRVGDMTAQELAEETGKKVSSIRSACGRMVAHGFVEATREGSRGQKVYSVADDVWAQLEAITPHLRTYKLSAQREAKRLESAQQWTKAEIEKAKKAGEVEKAQGLERRFAKQAKQRIPHLSTLHPDLSAKEIERLAYEVSSYKRSPEREAAVRENRTQAQHEKRANIFQIISAVGESLDANMTAGQVFDNVTAQGFHPATVQAVMQNKRMMHDAAGQAGNTILLADIAELRATGATDKEITRQLEYAGFIPSQIKQAMTTGVHA